MEEEEDKGEQPLLGDILSNKKDFVNEIEKKDEEMRDSFENYSKLLNKMKKNVENMGQNKLMNYQNLFNEFDQDMIRLNEEQKKLIELKEILSNEVNLPDNIKKNLSKVNKDIENKKYDNIFNDANKGKNENDEDGEQKLIIKNNEQIIEERKNIIEQAKKTSSQVVDTSKVIKNVINQQGECINDIENNIAEAVDNFKKGGEEIKKIKKKTEEKIDKKKLFIVIGACIVLFLVILFLMKKIV